MEPIKALKRPVTLAEIKAHPRLKEMVLAKKARLSVSPVTDAELAEILKLGETKL
jgi:predicted RNA-binding protein with PUA-like domain